MSQVHQIAPFAYQVEPIELPDDGALLIETTGVELLDDWPNAPLSPSANSNDNATIDQDTAATTAEVVSFAATLPRVR